MVTINVDKLTAVTDAITNGVKTEGASHLSNNGVTSIPQAELDQLRVAVCEKLYPCERGESPTILSRKEFLGEMANTNSRIYKAAQEICDNGQYSFCATMIKENYTTLMAKENSEHYSRIAQSQCAQGYIINPSSDISSNSKSKSSDKLYER